MIKEAVILAGGFGTRLSSVISDMPKVMAPVNGRPFLDYQLAYLAFSGIKRVILAVGYKHEMIMQHYGDRFGNIRIEYSIEHEPLGTGGAVKQAFKKAENSPVLVLNGDTFFEIDLSKFHDFYRRRDAKIIMAIREVEDVGRFGAVETEWDGQITRFHEKSDRSGRGKINGGIYLIDKNFFLGSDLPDKFSLEKDFFEKVYKQQNIYAMTCRRYFIDIGVPDEYARTKDDFSYFRYF
jgi:D-glycero-alpha-D-manno-heptose 1-phosphate guanylyltransferase